MENKKCNHVWEEHNAYLKCIHCGELKIKEEIIGTPGIMYEDSYLKDYEEDLKNDNKEKESGSVK